MTLKHHSSSFFQALTPDDPEIQGTLGLTQVNGKLSPVQGFGIEFILGFVLVLVVFGVCDSNRNSIHIPAPLAIGLTVAVGHLAAVRNSFHFRLNNHVYAINIRE